MSGKKVRITVQSDYLNDIFEVDKFTNLVKKSAKALQVFRKKHPFDALMPSPSLALVVLA